LQIKMGVFNNEEPTRYDNLFDTLINFGDSYQLLADYRSYIEAQEQVDKLYQLPDKWTQKTLLTIGGMGYFSSDRTISDYAENIWDIKPLSL
ncbi:glycogen/starch/alpha-glucan phosphorylase, partial [Providencia sp. PROV193]